MVTMALPRYQFEGAFFHPSPTCSTMALAAAQGKLTTEPLNCAIMGADMEVAYAHESTWISPWMWVCYLFGGADSGLRLPYEFRVECSVSADGASATVDAVRFKLIAA
jgi:hypothetical protein